MTSLIRLSLKPCSAAGPSALLALAFCLLPPARAAAVPASMVEASGPHFLLSGRLDTRDPRGPVLVWQGSQASIDFEGASLALDFDRALGQNFFDVSVDQQVWVAAVPPGGPTRLSCPLPLSAGRHHLSLQKRDEASAGSVQFRGIEVAGGTRTWRPASPAHPLAMEFYGDSITAGACDEDGASDQWEDRSTHNALKSYAALTADAFGADSRNISVSGIGVVKGWDTVIESQVWNRLYPREDSPSADLSLWRPDIVLVNLGDNDAGFTEAHKLGFPSAFTAKYIELIQGIRGAYPHADIVLLMGGMETGFRSVPLNEAWNRAVKELESGDPRIHHYVFQHWSTLHPRVADHRILANELIAWLGRQPFMQRAGRPEM